MAVRGAWILWAGLSGCSLVAAPDDFRFAEDDSSVDASGADGGDSDAPDANEDAGDVDADASVDADVDANDGAAPLCTDDDDCPARAHATIGCSDGACVVVSCEGHYEDCDELVDTGCEVDTESDVGHCGACDASCSTEHVSPGCEMGTCVVALCAPGFDDCDDLAETGCETDLRTAATCGACDNSCGADAPICQSSTLSCVAMCSAPAELCAPTECVDLTSSASHCASCDHLCPSVANAEPTCTDSLCGYDCLGSFVDCDEATANGCEIDSASDVTHCGDCDTSCSGLSALWECRTGVCTVVDCDVDRADCNLAPADGCETNTNTDIDNCGTCSHACDTECVDGECDPPVIDLDGSVSHACALRSTHRVECWGYTTAGLGDGTKLLRGTPVEVQNPSGTGPLRADAIAVGDQFSCAIGADGLLYCWGRGTLGALGTGSVANQVLPTPVVSLDATFSTRTFERIEAGHGSFACAVDTVGDLWCWGHNSVGQLGTGAAPMNSTSAVHVSMPSEVRDVALGARHGCAVLDDATVRCWGENVSGQVGDGSATQQSSPVPVPITDVASIDAGFATTCAIRSDDTLRCWGLNSAQQLGVGDVMNRFLPTIPTALPASVRRVAMGYEHTCATSTTGIHVCVGSTVFSQFTAGAPPSGVAVGATLYGFWYNGCALSAGRLLCWGRDEYGQLGRAEHNLYTTPTAMVGTGITELAIGDGHGCMIRGGEAYCFGRSVNGQLGLGPAGSSGLPRITVNTTGFTHTSVSQNFSCGLSGGNAYCWGLNTNGRLGEGTTSTRIFPAAVTLPGTEVDVGVGQDHACAIQSGGTIVCWGDNTVGQFGRGMAGSPEATPGAPVSTIGDAVEVRGGVDFSCARRDSGAVACWGSGTSGQLGNGASLNSSSPVNVSGVTTAIDIAVGEAHACAIVGASAAASEGQVMCWGSNASNAVGDTSSTVVNTPFAVAPSITDAISVGLGEHHSCLVRATGELDCWGSNDWYQLGDGTTTQRATPTRALGVTNAARLAEGGFDTNRTCFIRTDGSAACVGMAWEGRCGSGESLVSAEAAPVAGLP